MVAQTPVASTPANRAGGHLLKLDSPLLLGAVIALGAANFLWQLGASSYFVDEVLSIQHAVPALGTVNHLVATTETTPWPYFWALHVWLHLTGSQAEWVVRLPHALAGVALIAAVYWMSRAFLDRHASLLAALLTALSPLVLTYAQRVRVYVFVLLALTLAVGLVVRAARERPWRGWRLAAGAGAAILALWLHYTAAFVVVPLCLWLLFQRALPGRARLWFVLACTAGGLAELPLFLRQYSYAPNGGVGPGGAITALNVVRILETPFDGRYVAPVNAFRIMALVVLGTCAVMLVLRPGQRVREPRLLLALGACAPLAVLVLGLAGKDVVITRYTVVAAPLLLTVVAAGLASLPRAAAGVVGLLCATAGIWGLVRVHERGGFYPPAKEAITFIRRHEVAGGVLALPGHPGADLPLGYYAQRLLHPVPAFIEATDRPALLAVLRHRQPVWNVVERRSVAASPSALRQQLDRYLVSYGYRAETVKFEVSSSTFVVELLTPIR